MSNKSAVKYIFVIGGVMSGVGKGAATASLGRLMKARGFHVSAVKIDPYVNVDAGTMNPTEHGEVFVTEDGDETDQDIGNYERFLDVDITSANYMTTGRVYLSVIEKERNLEYQGRCVEVVPHIPEEVIGRIQRAAKLAKADIMLVEIGGTAGEYQNILFLEAARMMKVRQPDDVAFILVSYLPIPGHLGEMKTKPTQYAVRTLNSAGIQPDLVLCRGSKPMDDERLNKLAEMCSLKKGDVISAPDVGSIYEIPLLFKEQKLDDKILAKLRLTPLSHDLHDWRRLVKKIKSVKKPVQIAIVGKYFKTGDFTLSDSYISVIEALKHAAWTHDRQPELTWINTDEIEKKGAETVLKDYDGIVIPQGWGSRGAEGKIQAIRYARERQVPYFGLCYGMQMAVIEFARHVAGLKDAHTEEAGTKTKNPVIHIMPEQKELLAKKKYGGTIRLGAWPCKLAKDSLAAKAYGQTSISERHRHRYEFNNAYRERLTKKGLVIAGTSPDNKLVEIIELKDHPFFVGVQFHPEYKSRPLTPHPLFLAFIQACLRS